MEKSFIHEIYRIESLVIENQTISMFPNRHGQGYPKHLPSLVSDAISIPVGELQKVVLWLY